MTRCLFCGLHDDECELLPRLGGAGCILCLDAARRARTKKLLEAGECWFCKQSRPEVYVTPIVSICDECLDGDVPVDPAALADIIASSQDFLDRRRAITLGSRATGVDPRGAGEN